MAESGIRRRLAAIVAADVAGYSRLIGEDEEGTLNALRAHRRELIDPLLHEHHGRIANTAGDSLLIEFPSLVEAVRCSVAIQNGIGERNVDIPAERQIVFRIGINLGDVVAEGDDLLGDGVNVAARLEALAEPGGICLSRAARDQVRDRLDLAFEDLGEVQVKNIARPVRVYRIASNGSPNPVKPPDRKPRPKFVHAAGVLIALFVAGLGAWLAAPLLATDDGALPPTLETPRLSIVVLPFANLTGDEDQDYFADALTEDLTSDLSRISGSFVIARGTAATYRGTTPDPIEIAQELNVRYLLDGTVRKAGDDFRVGVTLIDGTTGQQVWSQRYEKSAGDMYAFQNEVTGRVARALNLELKEAESRQAVRGNSGNLDATDLALRGWAELWTKPQTPATNDAALEFVSRALEIEPDNAEANAVASYAYARAATYGWGMARPDAIQKGLAAGEKAVSRDPKNADAFYALAFNSFLAGKNQRALELLRHCIELNRNHAPAYFFNGVVLLRLGQPRDAIPWIERAFAISPRDPLRSVWHGFIARAYVLDGKDDLAIESARKGIAANRNHPHNYAALAAAFAHLGQQDEARKAAMEFERVQPGITVDRYISQVTGNDALALKAYERLENGLRKAGLE